MQRLSIRLTVLFQDPFWVGVYERECNGKLQVCKITFGAEPKDYEVHAFLLQNWHRLCFSPPVKADGEEARPVNPKRLQREIKRQTHLSAGIGTKAQQAIKLQQAQGKQARTRKTRLEREAEKDRLFQLRQEKRKQKHRGH